MPKSNRDDIGGAVRFHHLLPGLSVLEARSCTHRWVVFHETYTFCLVHRAGYPTAVPWRYNHQTYHVDRDHPVMAMQPGESHANLERTPPGDFIVVQIDDRLMKGIAAELGWTQRYLNLKHPHPQTNHPSLVKALKRFRRDICTTLFNGSAERSQCTCALNQARHQENLVELVSAFIQHCAEWKKELVLPQKAPALVRRAKEFLYEHYNQPFDLCELARRVGCEHGSYLDRLFKAELGTTPSEYQNRILVAKACGLLLENPRQPLQIVATKLGWPGRPNGPDGADRVQLMNKHFKRTLRVTPDQFRRGARFWAKT